MLMRWMVTVTGAPRKIVNGDMITGLGFFNSLSLDSKEEVGLTS